MFGSITAVMAQGAAMVVSVVSIPLTARYLGPERYGVWVTMDSLAALAIVSDLGLGRALVLTLSRSQGEDDARMGAELVSTAFWALCGIALLFLTIAAVLVASVSWPGFFSASTSVDPGELRTAMGVLLACFALSLPLQTFPAVFQAQQRAYTASFWSIGASIASLAALLVVVHLHGGLVILVVAVLGVPTLVNAVSGLALFRGIARPLTPRPSLISRVALRHLTALGSKYIVTNLASFGMFESQPLIIAHTLGPAQVGAFFIAERVISIPWVCMSLMTNPLLPAYSEARARNDWTWIWQTLRRSMVLAMAVAVVSAVGLWAFGGLAISLLSRSTLRAPTPVLVWLGMYTVLVILNTPLPVLLYASERVGVQAAVATANAVVTVVAGVVLTLTMGLVGMALAMVIGYALVNIPAQVLLTRRLYSTHLLR
jgi:O-antigen/teichoic acid export membrane protein